MTGCVVAELVNGPADGHMIRLAELRALYFVPSHWDGLITPAPLDVLTLHYAVYQLDRDQGGWPRIDDRGRYRYRYLDTR